MKNQRWIAAFTTVLAIFLLIEGSWAVWTIDAVQRLEVVLGMPYGSADDVAWARSHLPALYFVAIEGLLFGAVAIVGAVGLFTHKIWAGRLLLVASVLLTLTAAVAIAMMPKRWDIQGIFILFCVILWWESKKWRHE